MARALNVESPNEYMVGHTMPSNTNEHQPIAGVFKLVLKYGSVYSAMDKNLLTYSYRMNIAE